MFEETSGNQYTYRIELLNELPSHPESLAYLRFMEENGVECLATYMRWVYLRKKGSDSPFEIYTDLDSKIKHYRRILTLWTVLMLVEFSSGIFNLTIGFLDNNGVRPSDDISLINLVAGIVLISLGFLFLRMALPLWRKVKRLNQEKTIRE